MKALVTGGAGFLGSHVAECLVRQRDQVVVLDDLSGGFEDNVPEGAEFVKGSILDRPLLEGIFARHRFDHVFHLAAYAAEGLSHFIRRFNYENNLIGSINLINLSVHHRVRCFVFTSSIAVYGALPPPMDESMTPSPEDPYGIAKYAIELDLRAARRQFGLPFVIFRPHNVYGERQHIGDRYRNVVGIFMNQLMRGEPLTVFGDGEQTRAFTHVDDVAPVIASAPRVEAAAGEAFNIGGDEILSVRDLARQVMAAFGREAEIRHLPARQEVTHAYSKHDKVRRVFGAVPRVTIEDGLGRMARWAQRTGGREPSRFSALELTEGLPAGWGIREGARQGS